MTTDVQKKQSVQSILYSKISKLLSQITMKQITLLLFLALNAFAQNLPSSDPIQAGLSKDGLQRVETFLASESDKQIIPGCVGMVVRHGQVVYKKAFGKANLETGEAMRTDHLFRMAALGQSITFFPIINLCGLEPSFYPLPKRKIAALCVW